MPLVKKKGRKSKDNSWKKSVRSCHEDSVCQVVVNRILPTTSAQAEELLTFDANLT